MDLWPRVLFRDIIFKDLMRLYLKIMLQNLKLVDHKFPESNRLFRANNLTQRKWKFIKQLKNLMKTILKKLVKLLITRVKLKTKMMEENISMKQNYKMKSGNYPKKIKWLLYLKLNRPLLNWAKWAEEHIFLNFKNNSIPKNKLERSLREN